MRPSFLQRLCWLLSASESEAFLSEILSLQPGCLGLLANSPGCLHRGGRTALAEAWIAVADVVLWAAAQHASQQGTG